MASNVSSTTQSGQTSPTSPWLMNWERKPRFPLQKKREMPDYHLDIFSPSPGRLTVPIPIIRTLTQSTAEHRKVLCILVRLVKIDCCTERILEKVQITCPARWQSTTVRKIGLGCTWCPIITMPTCLTSAWILALALMRVSTPTFATATPTGPCPNSQVPSLEPDTPLCIWRKITQASPAVAVPRSHTQQLISNVTETWTQWVKPNTTPTLPTCSHLACNTTAASPAISTTAEHRIISRITGRIPFRGFHKPERHTVSPPQPIPHRATALAISTILGANSSPSLLLLTHRGWSSARICTPSSTRMRWIQSWRCSHIWWMRKNWRRRSSNWRLRKGYSEDFLLLCPLQSELTWYLCWHFVTANKECIEKFSSRLSLSDLKADCKDVSICLKCHHGFATCLRIYEKAQIISSEF